jgi:hypothetical protein
MPDPLLSPMTEWLLAVRHSDEAIMRRPPLDKAGFVRAKATELVALACSALPARPDQALAALEALTLLEAGAMLTHLGKASLILGGITDAAKVEAIAQEASEVTYVRVDAAMKAAHGMEAMREKPKAEPVN